jgi:glycosyltransferase involved in cell wall biosynthesis
MDSNDSAIKRNVLFAGKFSYPDGMAGTKRVQHAIDLLSGAGHRTRVAVYGSGSDSGGGAETGRVGDTNYLRVGYPLRVNVSLPLRAFSSYKQVFRVLEDEYQPDARNILYHYKGPDIENIPVVLRARSLGYRIVFDITEDTEHEQQFRHLLHRFRVATSVVLRRSLSALCDGLIVVSRHLHQKFKQRFRNRIPIWHRPISVDMNTFSARAPSPGSPFQFLYSGSFAPKDGVELLIDAFDHVADRHPNVELVMTGKGETNRMDAIRKQIGHANHGDRMELTGYLPENQFVDRIQQCDVACMTRTNSAYANAGFPFKLGEYLAAGKPVIASRVNGIRSYLSDDESAILIEPGSKDAIADGMSYLLERPDRVQSIGRMARQIAQEHFSKQSQQKPLLRFLQRV